MTKLSEIQVQLINDLEMYVTSEGIGTISASVEKMIISLIEEFPEFSYDGIGFRAIRGEWVENKSNYSWSLDFESAVEACESFSHLQGDIYVYEAIIKGFDLDLFTRKMHQNKIVSFSPNFLSFALREKEILSARHNGLQFIETIKKLF